jgi:hypothetical protein
MLFHAICGLVDKPEKPVMLFGEHKNRNGQLPQFLRQPSIVQQDHR